MHLDKVTTRTFPETQATYTSKDVILYALGVGFGAEPLDEKHLRFVFEENLQVTPTFGNVLAMPSFWAREAEYGIDWRKLLHAEHRLVMHHPIAPDGAVVGRHQILGVRDKGIDAGAMLYQHKDLIDAANDDLICSVTTTLMLRGDGGCGDFGAAPEALELLPERAADIRMDVQTLELSPLIYRLSGDLNPLHIDPAVARYAGFERPILHGLCTKGFLGYALLKTFCDFDPSRLKSMALRFSRPVVPGDKLAIEFWGVSPGIVRFRASVPERNVVVLDRGRAEIL